MQYKINLREERDFGQKINAVFAFLQQNFKPLFRSLLFIAGPTALLGGIFMGLHQSQFMDFALNENPQTPVGNSNIFRDLLNPNYFLAILFLVISFILVFQTVYGYLAAYLEDKNRPITTDMVWNHVKQKFVFSFFAMIVLGIITGIGTLLLLIPGIYFAVAFQLALIIIAMEQIDIFDLVSRCLYLVRGKWWSTFGLMFIVSIIQGMMGIVFNVPLYIITFAKAFHVGEVNDTNNIFLIISTIISTVGTVMLYTLSALAMAFQYFNLVERKEGIGLLEEVDQLGKSQPITDNEGDY